MTTVSVDSAVLQDIYNRLQELEDWKSQHQGIDVGVSGVQYPHAYYMAWYAIARGIGTAKGDLLVYTAAGVLTNLPVGANTKVLTADDTQATGMKWA